MEEWVVVAHLTRTRGNTGELCAIPLTDHPERFETLPKVWIAGTAYSLERVWYHKDQLILKVLGVDSISAAEALVGADVSVPAAERFALPDGEYYFSDLVGCRLIDDETGTPLGVITGWQDTGGPVILEANDGELLIPYAGALLKKIDPAAREIRVSLPEGLLDLNRKS